MKKIFQIYRNMPTMVKASFWFLICSFLQKGIATITTPVFTRLLTTAEYGQYNVFNSWLQILTPIICLNLYSGVYSQGLVKFEEDRKRYSSSLQGLCITLCLVWLAVYVASDSFWNSIFSLTTTQMVCMFIIIWTNATFSFWSMDQRVDFKYTNLVTLTLVSAVLQPIVCILFILNSEDRVTARILGMVVVQITMYVSTFIYQIARGGQFFSKKYWTYALKFNVPLLPHYLSMTVLASSDRIMISSMVGDAEVGIYSLAYSVSQVMTMFNTALLQTLEPWIYRKLKEHKTDDLARIAYPCFILIAAVNELLIIFAPEVITIFAPTEYQEAIWIIPSVTLSVFFTFLYTFFATFEFYYEKTHYIAIATVGGAVLNIVLNYIFIRIFGYMAAGYTTLLSYILFAVLHYYFMQCICKQYLDNTKPYSLKLIVGISLASIALGFIFMATYMNNILRYSLIAVITIIIVICGKRIKGVMKMLFSIRKERE